MLTGEVNLFEDIFYRENEETDDFFQLSDINSIICAGGIFSSIESKINVLTIISEALQPSGITKIYSDKKSKSPHLGILSSIEPDAAYDLYVNSCLEETGTIISPLGNFKKNTGVIEVMNQTTKSTFSVSAGEILFIDEAGKYEIKNLSKISVHLKNKSRKESFQIETDGPVLVDCRIKGKGHTSLLRKRKQKYKEFNENILLWIQGKERERTHMENRFSIERKLPYKGDILAKKGDKITPQMIVAQNMFDPPKLHMIDIRKEVGFRYRITEREIRDGLLIKTGTTIKKDQIIFQPDESVSDLKCKVISSVRGLIEKIEKSGMIIIREIQDYDNKPVIINISEKLKIKPSGIYKYLKYDVGDFVERNQVIAEKTEGGFWGMSPIQQNETSIEGKEINKITNNKGIISITSPSTGYIKKIDRDKGNVTIQYEYNPVIIKALVHGVVSSVIEGISIKIDCKGKKTYGIIGFGKDVSGSLFLQKKDIKGKSEEEMSGKILVYKEPISYETLINCNEWRVAGIIAPSVDNADWVKFCGNEIGTGVTGSEKIRFSVIITEGFGKIEMSKEHIELFSANNNKTASMFCKTSIRAGVIRPSVLIFDDEI
jgi:hypothetical protein